MYFQNHSELQIMGSQQSSEEFSEDKLVDSNGQVNNNIVIQEARDTHYQAIHGEKLVYAAYILISIEIIKLGICSYNMWRRQMKKRYKPTQRV